MEETLVVESIEEEIDSIKGVFFILIVFLAWTSSVPPIINEIFLH